MNGIIRFAGGLPDVSQRNDDDFSDRLNHRFTSSLMIMFSIVVSTRQYVGSPISCWVPAHFTGSHETYANDYCWVKNTYYLPFDKDIPKEEQDQLRHMIPYYQWMPIILLIQALMFYIPVMVWRTLNRKSGIDVNNVVEAGETFHEACKPIDRVQTLNYMTRQLDRYLESMNNSYGSFTISLKNAFSKFFCICCSRRQGNYLVALYFLVKLLFLANVIGQLFLLNTFLGHTFSMYGIDVLYELSRGQDWTQSHRFPRVTMCDLKVRRLGNIQRYTVQCVLPINLFNEKIYLFIWFWMIFVATMTVLSLITWALRSAFATDRTRYVKKHLRVMNRYDRSDEDRRHVKQFVEEYLGQDGVFVLRLVGHNTNAITVSEFVASLWDNFRAKTTKNEIEDMDEAKL